MVKPRGVRSVFHPIGPVVAFALMRCSILLACVSSFAPLAQAQVLPFNEAGVTMGHHHIMVADVDTQRKIWVDALGGEPSGNPPLLFVKFPGVFLILSSGKGTEGTKGSAIDHFAFNVKDLRGTRAKLAALGVPISDVSDVRFDAMIPPGLDVHFFADPSLATPIAHRAVVFASTDPDGERAWWEKILGAKTTKDGDLTVSTIPGARLLFTAADSPPAPTRGRALDHTGIGVKDVKTFCEQLATKGVTCELMFNGAIAMITDPAGVTIEINSGLESR
jgi:catechol 2,3-dioxygenase-like lactoylglutathione lyase family enzyme